MPLRFAAALPVAATLSGKAQQRRMAGRAANDNTFGAGHDVLLRDALKHFAKHGLSAASVARREAERAFFDGDRASYTHWLGICRTLDRRLAAAVSTELDRVPCPVADA